MRVFIAVEVPETVKKYLQSLQTQLPQAKLRVVKDFHLTLKFLGELTPDKVDKVKQLLKNIQFKKFSLQTSGLGVFPGENYIRVVWAGLEPEQPAQQLQKQIEQALANEFESENRFKAHITLARVKFVQDKKEFLEQLHKIKTETIRFSVDRFKLKKSVLSKEGPVYEDVDVFMT